jgi:hypothetical protein
MGRIWKDDIQYMKWKIIQPCLKPPSSRSSRFPRYQKNFIQRSGVDFCQITLPISSGFHHRWDWLVEISLFDYQNQTTPVLPIRSADA